jgi:hypothetical protein
MNARDIPTTSNVKRPDPVDAGTYPARVVMIATLGLQPQRPYQGEDKPPTLEILVTYELLDEFMKDEDGEDDFTKPRWITEIFPFRNLTSERAKSTARYFALDPKVVHKGDWSKLINTPCMVTIVVEEGKGANAGKFYENVDNVATMRPKEADKAEPLVNTPVVVDFYDPDKEEVAKLPLWIRKRMALAVDYEGSDVEEIIKALGDEPHKKAEDKKEKKDGKLKAKLEDEVDDEIPW